MLPQNYQFVHKAPVIPVMVINDIKHAVPMARALIAGGLTTLEITLRTDCALEAIKEISNAVSGADIGAGTVCNGAQFDAAIAAGARFIVSPGSSETLFTASKDTGIPLLPGGVTASEVLAIQDAGFPVIKFFPAETSGGAAAIKALGGPFGDALFVPTGGIGLHNVRDYLTMPNVAAVGGSWILPAAAVQSEDWTAVTRLAAEAVALASTL
tara:strand:+ start:373 stop:1008 length:636 start_codon:yes stop_codon:yes gene_type:complete